MKPEEWMARMPAARADYEAGVAAGRDRGAALLSAFAGALPWRTDELTDGEVYVPQEWEA